ncbi:MAG: hypothetical protein PHI31_17470 [Desulfuromonadaceae bacterium]|nr:hypothetical protein [Desulfuromonadaceae bacterium]
MRYLLLLLGVLVMAGCATNSAFIYKPAVPVTEGLKLPISLAVLPFMDGTEDFTKRGSIFNPESLYYNLAKANIGGQVTSLTPDLWAKAFADDMASSGDFRSVRFVYGQSELSDEDFYIEGTLKKATVTASWALPNEFALSLQALQRADKRLIWEKDVMYSGKNTPAMYDGCGATSIQCMQDRNHADVNRVMRGLFAEARADLMRTLAPRYGKKTGTNASSAGAPHTPQPQETVDEEIERILKGQ